MKDYRLLYIDLLKERISALQDASEYCWEPIGGGNPYNKCRYCDNTNIEGHSDTCPFDGGSLDGLRLLLEEAEKEGRGE